VGEKTAKVVLQVLYGQKWIAVDTHVHRVMNRLGIVRTKTPEQSSKRLEQRIPDEYKDMAHRSIIYFGRYLCTARSPQCERCPLIDLCNYHRNVLSKRK
jgi:endonuclease-3